MERRSQWWTTNCLYWHNHHGLSPNQPSRMIGHFHVSSDRGWPQHSPSIVKPPSSWCWAEATPICHLHQGNRSAVGSEGLLEKGVSLMMDKWTLVGFAQLFGLEWIWCRSWGFDWGLDASRRQCGELITVVVLTRCAFTIAF